MHNYFWSNSGAVARIRACTQHGTQVLIVGLECVSCTWIAIVVAIRPRCHCLACVAMSMVVLCIVQVLTACVCCAATCGWGTTSKACIPIATGDDSIAWKRILDEYLECDEFNDMATGGGGCPACVAPPLSDCTCLLPPCLPVRLISFRVE